MRAVCLGTLSLAWVLVSAAPAAADAMLYVCTPTAQVLAVDASSATAGVSVLYTHPSAAAFHDCVFGPDGRLYIAADAGVLRFDPSVPSEPAETVVSGHAARGLAFNVSTLYFTVDTMSSSSAVYQLAGQDPADDGVAGNDDGPIDFSGALPVQAFPVSFPGRGIAFDYFGNMVVASGATLQRASPASPIPPPQGLLYSSSDPIASGMQPVGVALNTCKQIVYADGPAQAIRRVGAASPLVTFAGKDEPAYLEIASDNTIYVVTRDRNTGVAKIWRVGVAFETGANACSTAGQPELLVDLKPMLNGPGKLDGLASALATGIAVAPTHVARTNTFSAADCANRTYDFGYHKVIVNFADCSAFSAGSTDIQLEALKSTLSQATFDAPSLAFPSTPIEGMRYSAMGGLVVQYRYTVTAGPNPFPAEFQSIFVFETQERVATPGVARAVLDALDAEYTQNVGDDYWLASVDPAGARGNDISKRVVFNAGLAKNCVLTFEEPFESGNPLFKSGQSMKVAVLALDSATGAPCTGGMLRVSVSQTIGNELHVKQVIPVGNSSTGNQATEAAPGKYTINVDLTSYAPGTYDLFVWGTLASPIHRTFTVQQ